MKPCQLLKGEQSVFDQNCFPCVFMISFFINNYLSCSFVQGFLCKKISIEFFTLKCKKDTVWRNFASVSANTAAVQKMFVEQFYIHKINILKKPSEAECSGGLFFIIFLIFQFLGRFPFLDFEPTRLIAHLNPIQSVAIS